MAAHEPNRSSEEGEGYNEKTSPPAATMEVVPQSNKRVSVENTAAASEATSGGVEPGTSLAIIAREKLSAVPPPPPVYVSPRKESKRTKMDKKTDQSEKGAEAPVVRSMEGISNTKDATSAGSREEYRREQ